jgi:hypothetical protein
LNGTICLLLLLDAQRTREEDFFLSSVSHRLPLSLKPQKDADPTGGLTPPAGAPVYPALSPDRTEAGHFHRPSLPINTEAEKRHEDNEKREGQDKGGDTREKTERERTEEREEKRREAERRRKKKEAEKRMKKQMGEREKKNSTAGHREPPAPPCLSPPPAQPRVAATVGQPFSPSSFSCFFSFVSSLHCSRKM